MCDQHGPFPSAHALSELPWFEQRGGRLTLAARDEVGPIADVHTHLALAYVRRMRVDLFRAPRPTEHYLPMERALDLDVYMNRNMSKGDIERLKRDLTIASMTSRGMRATHTVPNLTREMAEVGVAASVLLPIDFPVLSSNAESYLEVAAKSPSLPSLGSVHPYARDMAGKMRRQKAAGARGIKFHPAVQLVAPDHERAIALFDEAGRLDLPVLMHCGPVGIDTDGAKERCHVPRYEEALRRCRHTTFILGHSGALEFEDALDLCRRYENAYLEISCQSLGNVCRIASEAPSERIMFGSDWPFYHQAIPLAKALIATEGKPDVRRRLLWENAARVFRIQFA